MLDKYIWSHPEKYKANYSQSKSTGQIFFEVSVTASNKKELKKESEEILKICIATCNKFNKQTIQKKVSEKTDIKTNARM